MDNLGKSRNSSKSTIIPAPDRARQYRAIGLVYGTYIPSLNFTQGILLADGVVIEAFLLGRVISLVKKRLDLAKPHLWVVYPRSCQEDDKLRFQISGVWEPQTLHNQQSIVDTNIESENRYFSIRGKVVFASRRKQFVIVKIRQSPKKKGDNPKFFKVKLRGVLPAASVQNFYDIHAQLQGEVLTIVGAMDLGLASKQKKITPKIKKK